jgi:hypothetical protein
MCCTAYTLFCSCVKHGHRHKTSVELFSVCHVTTAVSLVSDTMAGNELPHNSHMLDGVAPSSSSSHSSSTSQHLNLASLKALSGNEYCPTVIA